MLKENGRVAGVCLADGTRVQALAEEVARSEAAISAKEREIQLLHAELAAATCSAATSPWCARA